MRLHSLPRVLGILVGAVFALTVGLSAQAGMIATKQVVEQQQVQSNKQKLRAALAREDVKHLLLAHGVTPQQAEQRINQLTNQEVHQLATSFDELPAPAGAGVLLIMSGPALLLLEFMGMTDLTTAF